MRRYIHLKDWDISLISHNGENKELLGYIHTSCTRPVLHRPWGVTGTSIAYYIHIYLTNLQIKTICSRCRVPLPMKEILTAVQLHFIADSSIEEFVIALEKRIDND